MRALDLLFCQRRTLPPPAATWAIQCSGMTGSSLRYTAPRTVRQVRAHEDEQRRQLAYDKARVERDRLTEALADLSPAVFRLANIMAHIDASDREIRQVNATLPQGRMPLLSAVGPATPAIAFLFDELLVRDAFLAIASAPDRYGPQPGAGKPKAKAA